MPQPPRRRGARTALRCAKGLLGVAALMALATGCAGQVSGAWSSDNIPPANLTERRAQLIADDRRWPSVYVVGVQKGGTTSIAHWLWKAGHFCHPTLRRDGSRLGSFRQKEVRFFDHEANYARGSSAYLDQWHQCTVAEPRFDASPMYLATAGTAQLALATIPSAVAAHVRIVASLRESAERRLSRYNDYVQACAHSRNPHSKKCAQVLPHGDGDRTKAAVRLLREGGCTSTEACFRSFQEWAEFLDMKGQYGEGENEIFAWVEHLADWADAFGRDKLLVLNFDELTRRGDTAIRRLEGFVGINGQYEEVPHANERPSPLKIHHVPCDYWAEHGPKLDKGYQQLYRWLQCSTNSAGPAPRSEAAPWGVFESALESDARCGVRTFNASGLAPTPGERFACG